MPDPDRPTVALLDWTGHKSPGHPPAPRAAVGRPAPCVICARPAIVRAPNGEPCHKTCAETRPDLHPRLNQQPDSPERSTRHGR
jgi:hypothetical protein